MSECLKHVQTDVILCYTVLDPDLFAEYSIKRERETEKLCYIYIYMHLERYRLLYYIYVLHIYICVCVCVCILESRFFLQVLEGEVRPTKPY